MSFFATFCDLNRVKLNIYFSSPNPSASCTTNHSFNASFMFFVYVRVSLKLVVYMRTEHIHSCSIHPLHLRSATLSNYPRIEPDSAKISTSSRRFLCIFQDRIFLIFGRFYAIILTRITPFLTNL